MEDVQLEAQLRHFVDGDGEVHARCAQRLRPVPDDGSERAQEQAEDRDGKHQHDCTDGMHGDSNPEQSDEVRARDGTLGDAYHEAGRLAAVTSQEFLETSRTLRLLDLPGGVEEGRAEAVSDAGDDTGRDLSRLPAGVSPKRQTDGDQRDGQHEREADRQRPAGHNGSVRLSFRDGERHPCHGDQEERLGEASDEGRCRDLGGGSMVGVLGGHHAGARHHCHRGVGRGG